MTYQKPALLIDPALEAVKGSQSKDGGSIDTPTPSFTTPGAYEADE